MPSLTNEEIRQALKSGHHITQRSGQHIVLHATVPSANNAPSAETSAVPSANKAEMGAIDESKEDLEARVTFELALKELAYNHKLITAISFKGVDICRDPHWIQKLGEALGENTTCSELDLSSTGLTDVAVQQLAATLCSVTKAPQLEALILCNNPLSPISETVLSGLQRMRPKLQVKLAEVEATPLADGFVCQKQLIEGLSAWTPDDLLVPGSHTSHQSLEFYCPKEISGEGNERVTLTRSDEGSNGVKWTCDLATFEQGHETGNFVLIELTSKKTSNAAVLV